MDHPNNKKRNWARRKGFVNWVLTHIESSYNSPAKLIVIIALSVFLIEALIMVFLLLLPGIGDIARILLDPALVVVFLSPVLYFFIFRPLLRLMRELDSYGRELKTERDKIESYLEVAGVMILVLDTSGKVVLINRKGCDILGYSETDIVGADWFTSFVPERARAEVWRLFQEIVSGGADAGGYFENSVKTKDGTERVILWHNALLREDGLVIGTLSSGEDITERKRIETALKESERRYRLIHNTVFDGIIITDAADTIVDTNPSVEKMFGYGKGELVGKKLITLMPESYRERHAEGMNRFLETGVARIQGKIIEVEGLKKNGEVFPIELIISTFSLGGVVNFTGTIRDITERKRAEVEKELIQIRLSQSQKMEAIGRFSGGIAHDFNNILTAIRGNAELALESVDPESPLYSRLDGIVLSVMHASKLTRQLLLFSRGQPFELQPVDINGVLENMLKMVTRIISRAISVATELDPGLRPVEADEGNIEQVIMNLIINATDAMPSGGTLTVKTENVALEEHDSAAQPEARPGDFVRLTVTDTGTGIKEELIQHIFEPFFTTKEAGKGMGFGLAMVYGVIKQHGGWITVTSEPGKGASFSVYLPAIVKGAPAGKRPAGSKHLGRGERILLVDDEKSIRDFSRTVLSENGYTVFTAATAGEATEVFEREQMEMDLVISDVVLPDQSGFHFLDYILSKKPGTPVLLCGSFADVKSEAREPGAKKYRYLQKPYSLAGLLRAVTVSLESRHDKT